MLSRLLLCRFGKESYARVALGDAFHAQTRGIPQHHALGYQPGQPLHARGSTPRLGVLPLAPSEGSGGLSPRESYFVTTIFIEVVPAGVVALRM